MRPDRQHSQSAETRKQRIERESAQRLEERRQKEQARQIQEEEERKRRVQALNAKYAKREKEQTNGHVAGNAVLMIVFNLVIFVPLIIWSIALIGTS